MEDWSSISSLESTPPLSYEFWRFLVLCWTSVPIISFPNQNWRNQLKPFIKFPDWQDQVILILEFLTSKFDQMNQSCFWTPLPSKWSLWHMDLTESDGAIGDDSISPLNEKLGAPSWISKIIGKLGGCFKEFVIFISIQFWPHHHTQVFYLATFLNHIVYRKHGRKPRWWFEIFFIFIPQLGEVIQFDEHIFQMGWFNHQLETNNACIFPLSKSSSPPAALLPCGSQRYIAPCRFVSILSVHEDSCVSMFFSSCSRWRCEYRIPNFEFCSNCILESFKKSIMWI